MYLCLEYNLQFFSFFVFFFKASVLKSNAQIQIVAGSEPENARVPVCQDMNVIHAFRLTGQEHFASSKPHICGFFETGSNIFKYIIMATSGSLSGGGVCLLHRVAIAILATCLADLGLSIDLSLVRLSGASVLTLGPVSEPSGPLRGSTCFAQSAE